MNDTDSVDNFVTGEGYLDDISLEEGQDILNERVDDINSEAYFYFTLHDFEDLVNRYGAKKVVNELTFEVKQALEEELWNSDGTPF